MDELRLHRAHARQLGQRVRLGQRQLHGEAVQRMPIHVLRLQRTAQRGFGPRQHVAALAVQVRDVVEHGRHVGVELRRAGDLGRGRREALDGLAALRVEGLERAAAEGRRRRRLQPHDEGAGLQSLGDLGSQVALRRHDRPRGGQRDQHENGKKSFDSTSRHQRTCSSSGVPTRPRPPGPYPFDHAAGSTGTRIVTSSSALVG